MSIAIIPTILATTEQELMNQYALLMPLTNRIQIDVADGDLVDGKTLPLATIVQYLITHSSQFPHTLFDFHLMVRFWTTGIALLEEAAAHIHVNSVLSHYAARQSVTTTLTQGVVFSPGDPIDTQTAQHTSLVQIMTVEPGKQGNPFIPSQLTYIKTLREGGYTGEIILDGGINPQSIAIIMQQSCLPSGVGVGSYLTHASNASQAYAALQQVLGTDAVA
ncbi:MAG: hypothetical protein NUV52_01450 [Candidatus Roizmanbacteria bacterium]|nr:hypothetical protein [Candidatus Roizmanbacteria bacterium]